jgi:phage tail P2-like protein
LHEIYDVIIECIILPRIDEITNLDLLTNLAVQFHLDVWDESYDLQTKRDLIKNSLPWHMTKGTVQLIQDVINTFFPGGATLQEWYQYKSPLPPNYPDPAWHDRYRFRILVDQAVISAADETKMMDLINRYKPISRWLESIEYTNPSVLKSIYWAGVSLPWHQITSNRPTYP